MILKKHPKRGVGKMAGLPENRNRKEIDESLEKKEMIRGRNEGKNEEIGGGLFEFIELQGKPRS